MTDTETSLDIIEKGPLPDEVAVEPKEEAATETAEEPEKVEASEEDTQEEADDSEGEPEEEPEKPKRRRNRTAKLAAKLTNAEQQIATLTQQIQSLRPEPQPAEVEPKQEDFPNFDEFVVAKAVHAARQEAREATQGFSQKVKKATEEVENQHRETEWNKREAKAREKYADYDEIARDEDLSVSPLMATAMKQMDEGTDVAYHLGTHPEESARIAQLQPMSQVIELGRIASKLAPPKRKQTNASPPVRTVKGGSVPQGLTPENAPTMADFIKARQAQEKAGQA